MSENLPDGWKRVKLGEVCDIVRGSSPRPIQDYISDIGGTPWVKISDATSSNSRYISSTKEFIKKEGEEQSRVVFPGDLIVSNSATPGIPRFMKIRACIHDGWLLLRNFRNIEKEFLYYLILNERERILIEGNGSIFTNLKTDILKNLEILIPEDINEQKAIAGILSSLDDKIDLLHKQNKTLEEMAQTLFRKWFIEDAKEDWEEERLGDIVEIKIGRTPPRKEFQWFSKIESEENIKWVSVKDLGENGVFILKTDEFLTKEAVKKFKIPVIPPNTVLLSFKMTVGRVGITTEEMVSNEAIAHFKFNQKTPITTEYLYLFLKSFKFQELGSTSTIVTSINSAIIKDIKILIPDKNTMLKFHNHVSKLFEKIKNNQFQIRTLEQLRDTLLPKLMSGEVRIKI